ncbi:hypothetical protein BO82DRAFT_278091 [Aspergillus uvarum CBS 121591]|uniref:Uncharacterized protein n=1 Tax=Aspergillus uvarum CBS 121591 TaxID=1448315 RepID=A0A319CFK8_9EURO|nr:hypothetical protein BO82DRAFT_278091 [Aspergillus uvarum CBS 121591]PYH84034.1 hypothetical protein BO82DRAFT_278091 [Aspergillus uvarum CBS 121591]
MPPSPAPPKRIILEKSRTVRRRYQRSNKRFQFTASQIARIEREQARERRAQQLRDRDRQRVAAKKKKAEKEARDRQERRRLGSMGLPDPNAPVVPSSQPSLLRFIQKPAAVPAVDLEGWESGSVSGAEEVAAHGELGEEEGCGLGVQVEEREDAARAAGAAADNTTDTDDEFGWEEDLAEVDEFSDCSIFDDEEIIQKSEDVVAIDTDLMDTPQAEPPTVQGAIPASSAGDSFQDDTAILLEQLGHEFDTDEEFEQALVALDAV